jgi:hypothetical protein
MMKQILKDLVESYQESEFTNRGRDIGYFKARRELLSCGKVYFYEIETTYPKHVTDKGCISVLPNPIIADVEGRFPEVDGEGLYRVQVEQQNGDYLSCIDPVDAGALI